MSADGAIYLDSSAIVKLVVRETETPALRHHLHHDLHLHRPPLISSALARTEVLRAVMAHGDAATRNAQAVLDRIALLRIDDAILRQAGKLHPTDLRSLDAIHLASALVLEDDLAEMICYDNRLTGAARAIGIAVAAPR